ncbi:MAG: insulinase family protein [Candidatus Omnitrophica bacterium]|nr:insulinase family protein [Candidatus Omnitrophota bacterium]
MVKRIKFPSGLELVFKEFKNVESASIGIWVRRGARCEPLSFKGIAHYLEHLLFKGTRNYSYKKIKQQIEGRGGQLNGFTSQEVTCYFAKILDKNCKSAFDVLSDMVASPLLKKEDIQRERGVILEEIRMYNDMPSSRVASILEELIWSKHPLGMDVIGTRESVKRISQKSLREFKNVFYRPSNIVVAVCAKSLPEDFEKIIRGKFADNPRLRPRKSPRARFFPGLKIKQEVTSFQQTHLSLGLPGFSYSDKKRFILELVNIILGANMSSRLFEEIREKRGLAYEVSTGLRKYKDTGAFVVHCGLDSKNVELAFKVIIKEFNKLKEKLVGRDELLRAKDYFLGNLSMLLESTLNSMLYIGESVCTLDKVFSYQDIEREALKITAHDIRRVCREIFSYNRLKVAIVTNRKESYASCLKRTLRSLA